MIRMIKMIKQFLGKYCLNEWGLLVLWSCCSLITAFSKHNSFNYVCAFTGIIFAAYSTYIETKKIDKNNCSREDIITCDISGALGIILMLSAVYAN